MQWREFLFSFRGRANRSQFWLMVLVTLPFIAVAAIINRHLGYEFDSLAGPGCVILLPTLWPSFAVTIRRWHDRNKSGWWLLINFIPLVGGIWSLVENGFLGGTPGANRFGPEQSAQKT